MTKTKVYYPTIVFALLTMSVVMFSGIAQAGEVPNGFVEIPWGASPEVVEKAMADRHFPKDSEWKVDHYIYDGSFAGYPAYLSFHFKNNKFVEGGAVLIEVFHSIDDGTAYDHLADKYFDILEGQLIQKYGKPEYRYRVVGGEPWKPWHDYWTVLSAATGHTIRISLDKCHAYKDRQIDQYARVAINYHNITMDEYEKERSKDHDL